MAINSYTSLTNAKAAYPSNALSTGTTYDTLTTSLITRYSRKFDRDTNRSPGAYFVDTDVTYYFDGPAGAVNYNYPYIERLGGGGGIYGSGIRLYTGEMAAAPTSVGVSHDGSLTTYVAYTTTDYYPGPYNALGEGKPYTWLELDLLHGGQASWYGFRKGVKVVAKFGYAAVTPDDVELAILMAVIRGLRRAEQNYVDTGVLLDSGQVMQGTKLEQDYYDAVEHYRVLPI